MAPTNSSPKTKSGKASDTQATAAPKPSTRVTYIRQTGERAVDVPVGAVLTARERVSGAVQPWTRSESRSKELKGLRTQVKTELDRFERRGGQARRRATDRVAETRGRVGERLRGVRSSVSRGRDRVGDGLKKAQATVQARVPSLP